MTIGEYVKQYRKSQGLSMQAFGEKCNLSRAYISILEKGINPTTGKAFAPTIETLNKIAEVTGVTIDTLLPMLDSNQLVTVNAPASSSLSLTQQEETHIKKYRQLDADGRERVDYVLDMEHKLANERAEKEEQRLG
mgnify:CR=1 FL=1|jgi:prophage lambdaSa1, repressor protein, putative|nr:MAG TPA: helix-turn-helix domain protein [Caudoviricetes sp.]